MAKQARKVSLISVHDYTRHNRTAYHEIFVDETKDGKYPWSAAILSYENSTILEKAEGVEASRDEADTKAQTWCLERMNGEKYVRKSKGGTLNGYAIPIPVDLLGEMIRDAYGLAKGLWDRLSGPMFALAYNVTLRNARLDAINTAINAGAGAGLLRIYDGSRPATGGTATTLLAELTFSDPAAAAAAAGVLTMSAITSDASANATGTATWFRCVDSTGTQVIDGSVATSASDLNLNSTSINSGVQVSVTSFTITAGNP